MASTYSTNLAIELIGTGEQSGTWGTTTNTNLGTLIEQAISGYVTQAITDGADTTITIPNGATGVARNMSLELTGALTAARNLIVPANKKLYFIYNNTTGGYAVTVKVSGQTGVSVPNGAKMALSCNGTDVYTAINSFAVTGTANRVAYFNSTGNLTNSSALTFDGTNFATTGTSSATKFIPTGGTATGNGMYLPATNALAWSNNGAETMRLDASGNLGLGVTPSAWSGVGGVLQVGTSAAIIGNSVNSSSFISNAYYDGSNYRYIGSGYAARFATTSGAYSWNTAASGTAGNVISFTTPMTLDASGNLAIGGTTNKITGVSGGGSGFTVQAVGAPTLAIWDTTDTSYYTNFTQINEVSYIWNIANGAMIFGTNNTERARITSGGYFKASNSGTYLGSTGSYHELRQDADGLNVAILSNYSGTNAVGIRVYYASYSPNGTGNLFLNCDDAGGARFQVRSNGGLANYSANDVNLSDRREKTNFAPAKDYLDTICAIPVQTFNYIDQSEDDPGLTLGVVAQDVQAVAPELVMESNWGTEENPKMRLSIYQTDLQYALMKCIQEQQVMINELKAEVAALKGA